MIRYNPALDGLRAVSVIAVVLYHAGAIGGGWIGVEVFFVISGYLITSLLIAEHERTGRIELLAFWRRRARRLLPGIALLAVVAAAYLAVFESSRPSTTATRDMVGLLTYSSNWTAITGGGYWASFGSPSPLRHAWSLAVEEQFYLVFPLLAVVLLRRRVLGPALFAMTAAAAVWQVVARDLFAIDRVYLGTDTRAFGLLAGASLAVVLHRRTLRLAPPTATAVGVGALATLAAAAVVLESATARTFGGPFQLVVVASVVLILAVHDPARPSAVGTALAAPPLVHVGRWSYGIYLFHWPLLIAIEPGEPAHPWLLALGVLVITIPVAGASYRWFEHPIRRDGLGAFGGRRHALALGSAGLLVAAGSLTVAGAANVAARPTAEDVLAMTAPSAPPTAPGTRAATTLAPPPATVAVAATSAPTSAPTSAVTIPVTSPLTTPTSSPATAPTTAAPVDLRVERPADRPLRLYIVGDSVGTAIDIELEPIAGELGIEVFSRSAGGCGYDRVPMQYFNQDPQPEECLDVIAAWPQDVATFRPDVVLVAYGAWWGWYWNGAERTQCDADMAEHVRGLYDLAYADLGGTGAPVYFMAPADWDGEEVGPPGIPRFFDCVRDLMTDWAAGSGARIVDVYDLLCVDHDCASTVDGAPTRPDGVHFEGDAAPAVMVAMLDRMITPPPAGWPDYGTITLPG